MLWRSEKKGEVNRQVRRRCRGDGGERRGHVVGEAALHRLWARGCGLWARVSGRIIVPVVHWGQGRVCAGALLQAMAPLSAPSAPPPPHHTHATSLPTGGLEVGREGPQAKGSFDGHLQGLFMPVNLDHPGLR